MRWVSTCVRRVTVEVLEPLGNLVAPNLCEVCGDAAPRSDALCPTCHRALLPYRPYGFQTGPLRHRQDTAVMYRDPGMFGRSAQFPPQALRKRLRELYMVQTIRFTVIKTVIPSIGIVDDLVGNRDFTRMLAGNNYADGVYRDDAVDAERFERRQVGPIVDSMRRNEKPVAVPGQQKHRPVAIVQLTLRARGVTEFGRETLLVSIFAE